MIAKFQAAFAIGVVSFALVTCALAADRKPVPYANQATDMTFDSLRGVRYCEIWTLIGSLEQGYFGDYFNTSNLNNSANKMDTCPGDLWAKVTVKALEADYNILLAFKNGPRGWTMDSVTIPVGPVISFYGVDTRWWGRGYVAKFAALAMRARLISGLPPYKTMQSHRKSSFTFQAGKPVFIIEDPKGTPWVMQAFGQIIDPTLTYDSLKDLGNSGKLKLPKGWKYRVAVVEKDLIVSTPQGYNWIVQDNLGNTYDACKEGACNFQP